MSLTKCGSLKPSAPIAKLEFDLLITAYLDKAGKRVISDLTDMCACEVLEIDGVGWKALGEIIDTLHDAELNFNAKCRIQR